MKIVKEALAGTLESNDLMVRVAPRDDGLDIVLNSEVKQQFGAQIEATVKTTLARLGIVSGTIVVEDKGALDCTIRARVEVAVLRGAEIKGSDIDWSALS